MSGDAAGTRTATLVTEHADAAVVAAALRPDDTDSIRTEATGDGRVRTEIERETTGGLRTTVDDYAVNLTVAETVARTATRYDTTHE